MYKIIKNRIGLDPHLRIIYTLCDTQRFVYRQYIIDTIDSSSREYVFDSRIEYFKICEELYIESEIIEVFEDFRLAKEYFNQLTIISNV